MSQLKPYEFKCAEEIVYQLSENKVEIAKCYEKQETMDKIVHDSVGSNTFRAFPGHPSKVFRDWASLELQNQNNINELSSMDSQKQYDEWLRKFSARFSGVWQKQMSASIPYGPSRKLPNLLLKRFVLWDKFSRVQRANLLNYLHIPLDSYTLVGMRNCICDLEIPKNATMKFVKDETIYNRIQQAVRDITHQAKVPAIYFDNLAWGKRHKVQGVLINES